MTIYRGPGGTGTATSDADTTEFQVFLDQTEAARDAAVAAQAAAEAAEVSAETSKDYVDIGVAAAAASATEAAASASAASTSETNAASSETSAASSASAASTSASSASSSASAASTSETNAGNSATAAATSATDASASASAAASSASTATTQASNAAGSATAALASQTAAASSASSASTSATNAASSASSASTSATNAASSAFAASSSASTAASSASSAGTAAATATTKASEASTSATNAAASASSASTSASTATTQATNAAASASAAATSASSASTSASTASAAQTAAESARDAALSAYDNFDDRYLGPKTTDPTLDNDGNALLTGALYFNTSANVMNVYTGSAWVAAYVSAAGVLLTANNLSDVASTATSRTNLNVPTRTGGDASGTWSINITGNSATTTNGVVTTGSYANPAWITSLAGSKVSGNITGNAANVTGTVAVANGGTGSTTASAARTALGVAIGTDVQAFSTALTSYGAFGVSFKNRIINGDMRIDQRNAGASVSITTGTFVVDRFKGFRSGGAATITGQRSTTAPSGFTNSVLLTVGTGASPGATDYTQFDQNIEGFNTADLAWGTASAKAVTLSFWVRSSLTGTFGVAFRNDAGNRSYVASYTISAANTWEQKTITISGDTTGTWTTDNSAGIKMTFDIGVGSTYSNSSGSWAAANYFGLTGGVKLTATAGATFYITGVQLEAGSVASPFERRDYGRELMMCQRYLPVTYGGAGSIPALGQCYATTGGYIPIPLQVIPRVPPTGLITGAAASTYSTSNAAGSNVFLTSLAFNNASLQHAGITVSVASGLVAGNATYLFVPSNIYWTGCEL